MANLRDLKQQRAEKEAQFASFRPVVKGYQISVGGSVKVQGMPGWIWVQDAFGGITKAFNPKVSDWAGLPVLLQPSGPDGRDYFMVEDVDWEYLSRHGLYDGNPYYKNHAVSHEWRGGYPGSDAVTVYPAAWSELRTSPGSTGLTVDVSRLRYLYQGDITDFNGQIGLDLSAHQPSSGSALWVLISLDKPTNALVTTAGSTATDDQLIMPPRPTLPAEDIPSAYVRLDGDQTSIGWGDIINARTFVNGASSTDASTLQGVTVSTDTPAETDTLYYNSITSQWEPGNLVIDPDNLVVVIDPDTMTVVYG